MPLDDTNKYWIARGQQVFGPYTGAEVNAYYQAGNIALTDQIRGERDAEWLPLAYVLGVAPPPPDISSQPPIGVAGVGGHDEAMPLALWSLGLAVATLVCCGICSAIPGVIVGAFALQKPRSPGRSLAIVGIWLNILGAIVSIALSWFFLAQMDAIGRAFTP
ncbi:MAG: GYF domain-containing protein [Phycisphaerae bacterium]|nr:GYF domain-containing protein [Phycisphaerae bacterium]